jgi:hypothetical protein
MPSQEEDIYYMNMDTGETYDLENYISEMYEAEQEEERSFTMGIVALVFLGSAMLFTIMSLLMTLDEIYQTAFLAVGVASLYGLVEIGIATLRRFRQSEGHQDNQGSADQ